ncbi:MAG: 4Fe-4S dicluster domain-containing protein [Chloroflexi bacterium]|nr:4Fe-4S dicluster domain-containing protein [Chloroflexota bacterium]
MSEKVSKKDIAQLLKTWSQQFNVLAPSRDSSVAAMAEWDGKDTSFLDWYRNTVVPPKASFLPPMEAMFRFRKDEEGYQIEPPAKNGQKQLLFGIRPCDARAMAILDMTFEDAYKDPYYLEKRKKAVLVGLGCTNPCESCFCTSMGTSPTDPTNVDLMLIDIGDHFLIEEVTAKGKELIAKTSGLKEATKNDEANAEKARETAYNKVSRKLATEGIKDKLLESFDDEGFWEKVAAKCISCGICTLLCPTCYCFDINDELVKGEGTRFRSWDSCGFSLYTKMPMENPRQEKWRRVRQKVCHKYEFYPMAFDVIACTGCGRCIRLCPVNWDITQVIESVPARVKGAR